MKNKNLIKELISEIKITLVTLWKNLKFKFRRKENLNSSNYNPFSSNDLKILIEKRKEIEYDIDNARMKYTIDDLVSIDEKINYMLERMTNINKENV